MSTPTVQIPSAPSSMATPHDAHMLLAGGCLAIVGAFLPWATLSAAFVGTISVTGVAGGDGYVAIGLAVPLVVFAIRKITSKQHVPAKSAVTLSALLLAMAIFEFGNASNAIAKANASLDGVGRASVGSGLFVLVAGSVCALAGSIMAKNRQGPPASSVAHTSI